MLIKFEKIWMVIITLLIILVQSIFGQGFEIQVLTKKTPPGKKANVIFVWSGHEKAKGFNIYRKSTAIGPYSAIPVNKSPITAVTDCNALKSIAPVNSEEWKALTKTPVKMKPDILKETKKTLYDRSPGTIFEKALPFYISKIGGFNPCNIKDVEPGTPAWDYLQFLARRYYKISILMGQGFVDSTVIDGQNYWYEIRAIEQTGEKTLISGMVIKAGASTKLPAATNIAATPGDSKVMITWDPVEEAIGYDLYRKTMPAGTPVKVNESTIMAQLTQNLQGDSIPPTTGYIDFRRWDETGNPEPHLVGGVMVDGPINGTTYQYQVVAVNILSQPGNNSTFSSSVTPADQTSPGLPVDLKVESLGSTLKITWTKVTKDALGRLEQDGMKGYHVFRSENQSDFLPLQITSTIIPQPVGSTVQFIDSDPMIVSKYGEKEYYYRIKSIDIHDNISPLSSAAYGHTDDKFPPLIPDGVEAKGEEKFIQILWDLNTDPDIESYHIYRSQCHYGEWIPPQASEKREVDCGPFVLIGEIFQEAAKDSASKYGKATFNDNTLPLESPICYAYWVKAKDKSQNLSGTWPWPNSTEQTRIVCQRLRDKTPPPPPIVTAVQARDISLYLEWISAPCQDLKAFHIYRSDDDKSTFKWVGGLTIAEPPTPPHPIGSPYNPGVPCGCDSIPLVPHEGMKSGSFTDKPVDAKKIYWYKITSVDQNGNENKMDESIEYSSFTYKVSGPAQPVINIPIKQLSDKCGLIINWNPLFDINKHKGFIVFRSLTKDGIYRQLNQMTEKNEFIDSTINADVTYWYKVQAFDKDGRPSKLSLAQKAKYSK